MDKISSHKDLKVWQEAMNLVIATYSISKNFPKHEVYGLTPQMRRAAVSIPSNIAEGAGRKGGKEFSRFLFIALGLLLGFEMKLEVVSEVIKVIWL